MRFLMDSKYFFVSLHQTQLVCGIVTPYHNDCHDYSTCVVCIYEHTVINNQPGSGRRRVRSEEGQESSTGSISPVAVVAPYGSPAGEDDVSDFCSVEAHH